MPRLGEIKNRIGIHYGRLIAIRFIGQDWDGYALWLCKCDCGKEIIVAGRHLQSGGTKSCGCLKRETRSKQIGKNHPYYIDGHCKRNLELKEQRRKKDNHTCQDCGMIQEQNGRKLDVHHIDGDDTNNVEENMITLCRSCHKIEQEKLFKKKKDYIMKTHRTCSECTNSKPWEQEKLLCKKDGIEVIPEDCCEDFVPKERN